MNRRRGIVAILLSTMLLVLMVAVYQQITHQYHRGDQAMRYSSFREDPMGASVLFESLENIPELTVEKNTEPILNKLDSPNRTLVFLGAHISPDPTSLLEDLETFVTDGGKLVIAFSAWSYWDVISPGWSESLQELLLPEADPEETVDDNDANHESAPETASEVGENETNDAEPPDESAVYTESEEQDKAIVVEEERESTAKQPNYQDISERWGFKYTLPYEEEEETTRRNRDDTYYEVLQNNIASSTEHPEYVDFNLPTSLPWRSKVAFEDTGDEWTSLYTINSHAVVMHRHMGEGEILLISDSFLFSNECLKFQPQSSFISWTLGSHSNIVFNESHLGGMTQGNVMTLIRRYRLTGYLFAFVLVGLLFAWKNSVSLLPCRPALESDKLMRIDTYFDSTTTLSHLLRRGLDYNQLLSTAYDEWMKSSTYAHTIPIDTQEQIQTDLQLGHSSSHFAKLNVRTTTAIDALKAYNRLIARLRQLESRNIADQKE